MVTYNKTELNANEWYEDDCGRVMVFKGYRNNQLATFNVCDYNEKEGNYFETAEERYLTASEVKRLRVC